jgi:preprotein translocase subunit SecD
VVFLFTHPLISLFSRSAAFGSARFTGLSNVRAGGIATREEPVPQRDLVTVGGASSTATERAAARSWRRPATPVRRSSAPPERPAETTQGRPAETTQGRPAEATPAPGATAAERAAARRGLSRKPADASGDGYQDSYRDSFGGNEDDQ